MEQEKDRIIWQIISQLVQFHSAFHPEARTIEPTDRIVLYFPKPNGEYEEHANRWSGVLFDTIDNMNMIYKPKQKYKYSFSFREEWLLFQTLGDYAAFMKKMID